MKRILHILLNCMLLCCLGSCVDEFNAQLPESESNLLVVEGNIISDSTCVFNLSRSFSLNEEKIPEDYDRIAAKVMVIGTDGSQYTATQTGNGAYTIEIGTLSPQHSYHLQIDWEGNTYTSAPQQPLVTEDMELSFDQPEEYGAVHVRVSTTPNSNNEVSYYIWDYVEDWEIRTEYRCKAIFDPTIGDYGGIIEYEEPPYDQGWVHRESKDIYVKSTENYQDKRLNKAMLYSIASNDPRISHLYSTFITQRKVTKGEYEYYQCKERFTNDMGGLFTPQPSELPSNITCVDGKKRVIGYVGVNMNVSKQRLYIPTTEVQYEQDYVCVQNEPSFFQADSDKSIYYMGFRISYYLAPPMAPAIIKWAAEKCVDCRAFGADPDGKPDFWPNN